MVCRTITAYLMVGTLLACPFPCLAEAACAAGSAGLGGHSSGGGDCCLSVQSDVGQDEGEDCGCNDGGTCLCHGAVMKPHTPPPGPQSDLVAVVHVDEPAARPCATFSGDGVPLGRTACHFPSADSGRMVRALIESLLI